MKKQMISFTEPQHWHLVNSAKWLKISLAELVRRIIDYQIEHKQGTLPENLKILRVNGEEIPLESIKASSSNSGLLGLELEIQFSDKIPDITSGHLCADFLDRRRVFLTLGKFPNVVAGQFFITEIGVGDFLKKLKKTRLVSTGMIIGLD